MTFLSLMFKPHVQQLNFNFVVVHIFLRLSQLETAMQ